MDGRGGGFLQGGFFKRWIFYWMVCGFQGWILLLDEVYLFGVV